MRLDAETLAALMEGRLSDDERARALAILRDSDADLEVLGDAAAVLEALEGAVPAREGEPKPGTPSRSTAPGRSWTRWLPLAAVLAGLSVIPFLGGPDGPDLADLRRALGAVGPLASPLDLPPAAGGDAVRSGGADPLLDSLSASARSFRRGAAFARLSVVAPDARRSSADAATLGTLLASSAGSAARPAVDAWYGDEVEDEASWTTAAEAVATVEGVPAAFRMGLLIESASLLLAQGSPSGAADLLRTDLEPAFASLDASVRANLGDAFARLGDALDGGDLPAALDEFARRMATLRDGGAPGP